MGFRHGQQLLAQRQMLVDTGVDHGDIVAGDRLAPVHLFFEGSAEFNGLGPQHQRPLRQNAEVIHLPPQGAFHRFARAAVVRGQVLAAHVRGGYGQNGNQAK